eukprot:3877406-Pleurochrysis_carterae.AAC.1
MFAPIRSAQDLSVLAFASRVNFEVLLAVCRLLLREDGTRDGASPVALCCHCTASLFMVSDLCILTVSATLRFAGAYMCMACMYVHVPVHHARARAFASTCIRVRQFVHQGAHTLVLLSPGALASSS